MKNEYDFSKENIIHCGPVVKDGEITESFKKVMKERKMKIDMDTLKEGLSKIEKETPENIFTVSYTIPDDTVVLIKSHELEFFISLGNLQSIIGILESGFLEDYKNQSELKHVLDIFRKMGLIGEDARVASSDDFNALCDFVAHSVKRMSFNPKHPRNSIVKKKEK